MNFFRLLSLTKNEFLIGSLSFLLILILVIGSRQIRLTANDAMSFDDEIILQLPSNHSLDDLISALDTTSVNFNSEELRWSARLLGWRVFKAGSYNLTGEMDYETFFSKLALGIQDPVSIVVLPGLSPERFSTSIAERLNFESSDILEVFSDSVFLSENSMSPEMLFGRMLPETYLVYWTSSPKDIVRRILNEYSGQVIEPLTLEADSISKTLDEILIMASIVEWEANIEDEKSMISGLYWNRINRRMRLEADPTVNFALGERRRLLFEDYKVEHPYNTYLRRGLPPGPITNPSLSTILATLRPESHNYLYMVANPEGGHEFSQTFEEHQVASEKWRRWLREQYRIKRSLESQ